MNLYSKYRSQKFDDVVGQRHVVAVVTSAIKSGRVGHAYLFSGPRGTGKTTIARLLAKSLNCKNRKEADFEPCNKCSSCKEVISGVSMDIIEIDAASNRGIDEIRALRDKIKFAASGNKYKVFIIDEVHMLTREAFNALLKTLEEPPKHVVFILATTELHKVPDTIISRTQQFDFHLHNLADLSKQLRMIVKKENIKIDDESINLISQSAKGGMRDAITLLDQVSSVKSDIDEQTTRDILGLTSFKNLVNFIKYLSGDDTKKLLEIINKMYEDGVEFSQFVFELTQILRKILLEKYEVRNAFDGYTKDESQTLKNFSEKIDARKIVSWMDEFMITYNETKNASIVQLPLELSIINLTGGEEELNIKNSNNKIQITNENQNSKDFNKSEEKSNKKNVENRVQNKPKIVIEKKIQVSKLSEDVKSKKESIGQDEIKGKWQEIITQCVDDKSLALMLKNSHIATVSNGCLMIDVEFKFYKDRLEKKKIYTNLCEMLEKYFDKPVSCKFQVNDKIVKKIEKKPDARMSSYANDSDLEDEAGEVFS